MVGECSDLDDDHSSLRPRMKFYEDNGSFDKKSVKDNDIFMSD